MTKYPLPGPLMWLGHEPRLPELTGSRTHVTVSVNRKRAGLVEACGPGMPRQKHCATSAPHCV